MKGLECAYTQSSKLARSRLRSPSALADWQVDDLAPSLAAVSPPGLQEDCVNQVSDLKDPFGISDAVLVQHYLTHTAQTLVDDTVSEAQSQTWTVDIPALALTCPVVRRGLLTLAALCSHNDTVSSSPGDGQVLQYLQASEAHGNIFVKQSRQKLQDMDERELDSLLACSRLLCLLSLAFYRKHRANGVQISESAAWTWLQLTRGLRTTHEILERSERSESVLTKDVIPELISIHGLSFAKNQPASMYCEHQLLDFIRQTAFERFDAQKAAVHRCWKSLGAKNAGHILNAVHLLYQVTEHVCSKQVHSLRRAIFSWPAHLSSEFVELLTHGTPLALAVHAHWLMLVVLLEELWWIDDMGRAGIQEIAQMCENASSDVQLLMTWPKAMLDAA